MPNADYTDYYSGVISQGRYQLDTVDEAEKAIEKLVDMMITDTQFHLEQINLYAVVRDEIEGFIPLRPDALRDEAIYESVDPAYYISAILNKFPELEESYDFDMVEAVIDEMNDARKIVDSVRGKDYYEHAKWKNEIVKCFREALKYAKLVKTG